MLEWVIVAIALVAAFCIGYALGRTVEHIRREQAQINRVLQAHNSGAPGFYYYDEQFDELYGTLQQERRKRGE